MKTYVWLAPEKLKFINDNPQVVSLLYDLGLLPEEISARVRGYVEDERERCIKILHEAYANHKGASVQTAFPEDAKILLANMARVLGEMENEMRERVKKGLDCACGGHAPEICPTKDAEHRT